MTPHAKFHVNLLKGAFRQIGEIYAPTGQTPQRIFARSGSNDAVSGKNVPFGG